MSFLWEEKVLIIIPTYNEVKNIQSLYNEIVSSLYQLTDYEIIFVLDPSSDDSENVIAKNLKLDKKIKLIV